MKPAHPVIKTFFSSFSYRRKYYHSKKTIKFIQVYPAIKKIIKYFKIDNPKKGKDKIKNIISIRPH